MNTSSSWSIEYSHSKGNFHLGRTAEMLKRNVSVLWGAGDPDYVVVGIFPTKEQAEDALLDFRRHRVPSNTISML